MHRTQRENPDILFYTVIIIIFIAFYSKSRRRRKKKKLFASSGQSICVSGLQHSRTYESCLPNNSLQSCPSGEVSVILLHAGRLDQDCRLGSIFTQGAVVNISLLLKALLVCERGRAANEFWIIIILLLLFFVTYKQVQIKSNTPIDRLN